MPIPIASLLILLPFTAYGEVSTREGWTAKPAGRKPAKYKED